MLIKRGEALNGMIAGASMFFGGVLFPVESMPEWMQFLANFLPFTHALEGMRQAIQSGNSLGGLLHHYLILGVFIVVLMPLSWALFAYAVRKTRETGSLGHY